LALPCRTLTFNSAADHRTKLEKELAVINDMEMWRAGKTVRQLRPENQLAENEAGEAVA
jgi:ketol-acid reductoisomerase